MSRAVTREGRKPWPRMLLTSLTALGLAASVGWTVTSFATADAEARHPPKGHFITVPGGKLHVVDSGTPFEGAPVIVLIHGASSLHADLMSVLGPQLTAKARVIAFDRPGHGWSDRLGGREMASPALQAGALAAALDAMGIGKAVLVAHSLAGALALRMALDRPGLVEGLVLLGAVSHPWPDRSITWYYHPSAKPVLGPVFARLLAIPAGTAVLESSIDGVFAPQSAPPGYAESAQVRLVLRPRTFVANAEDVSVLCDFVEAQAPRYGELAMPVVAIAGEDDTVVWTDIHSRALVSQVRNGRLMTLPGVGHMPHHVVPDLIAGEALALARSSRIEMEAMSMRKDVRL
jgi:pimeloyl-ACP methyl ester carboxylesterase